MPPSPDTSAALETEFAKRDITFIPGRRISSVDAGRSVAVLDDGTELPFDLFLGVPKHRAPDVVIASGMTEDGYVPVDSATLRTRYPGVYAVGDVATAGVPKAGVFAEGAARVVARQLIAELRDSERPGPYDGRGSCYIEFGSGRVGRVDIDFLSGPTKTGKLQRAVHGPGRREGALRLQPPRALVRRLRGPPATPLPLDAKSRCARV